MITRSCRLVPRDSAASKSGAPYHIPARLAHSAAPSVHSAMRMEQPYRQMSLEDYLEWEEKNTTKHEYVGGEVYAMSGVTLRHNLITLNVVEALRRMARRRGCRVLATDVKLRAAADRIYYPDIIVACGTAAEVELIVEEPLLVVEVTSPSTRATDRREKLDAYMRIPSLRMYLMVEQRRRQVLVYSRAEAPGWVRDEILNVGDIPLPFLASALSMDEIYDDVPLPPLTVREGDSDDVDDWDVGETE